MKILKLKLQLLLLILISNQSYSQTVQIGSQTWMSKNLTLDTFRNGDKIPLAKTYQEFMAFEREEKPACFYYDFKLKNGRKFGKIYNWFALKDSRGLAPIGYHIPTAEEWNILINYLGGKDIAGSKLKSTKSWSKNGNGKNSSGFSGLAGGYNAVTNISMGIGEYSVWMSSSKDTTGIGCPLVYGLNYLDDKVWIGCGYNCGGLYVRCVKD
jgi:uncharacterized protein (TIGR02145 family)